MTRDDLYKALIAVENEVTGERTYSESEARSLVDGMSDEYVAHVSEKYDSPEEWAEYYTM